ncbi:uncharacterized protein V6R79_017249 [Siganus canaliculatus]
MIFTWLSVIVMLVAFVNGARNDDGLPCAEVKTSRSLVPLGSSVTATCVVRHSCPLVTEQGLSIEWRLDNDFVPSSFVANGSDWVSEVVIPSFSHNRGFLTCCVQGPPPQVVGGVEIRAGYPPEAPQNLSCQTNLSTTNTLTCRWDPGHQETHLLTKYTLHTKIWDSNENHTYEVLPGVHQYTIPRSGFILFSDMEIFVKSVNELGEAVSTPITLEPVSAAKFDPPVILKVQAVPKKYACLKLNWGLSENQAWMRNYRLNLKVQLEIADGNQEIEQFLLRNVRSTKPVDLCRLRHWTRYLIQIGVSYQQSPWSEWSNVQSGVTLESAPTGRLDGWMKVSGDQIQKQSNVHLFWKPSKQFRANGQNVSYTVSVQNQQGEKGKVCSSMGKYCTFLLPPRAKKVYLSAINAAGKSNPTEVRIRLPKAHAVISDVSAFPHDDRSLLVQWRSLVSHGLTDYVVEWRPLLKSDLSDIHFEIAQANQSSIVVNGSFKPYVPYGISVYPRFKDSMGLPQNTTVYLKQKAPSMVPRIQIKKMGQSHIEFTWDEIPLDQRNGIIQSYKVFYWHDKGPLNVVIADPKERKVVLENLDTDPLYEAFMMVSTSGGSLNGSMIHFEIEPIDAVAIVIIVTASAVGFLLLAIFIVMIYFSNHRRLKRSIWPAVPDPANSSIKRWTSESTQDTRLGSDSEEPNPIYLSHLSFLDIPVKMGKESDDSWLSGAEDTSDLGESICGSPFIPGYSGSNCDSVPYATVIFPSPCDSPTAKEPHVYLRSESTQPLLESEEPFTPKCYQNMATDGMSREQCFFGPCHDCVTEEATDPNIQWDEFPFLRALAMNDMQSY